LSTLGKVAHHTFHTQAGVAQALAVLAAELGSRIPGTSAQATARSTSAQSAAAALTPPTPDTTLAQPSPLVLIDADDCQLSPAQDVTGSAQTQATKACLSPWCAAVGYRVDECRQVPAKMPD